MAYFEMDTTCERCGLTLIFVGDGKKGAKKAARSHGWHFAVADMAICPKCQGKTPPVEEASQTSEG